MITHKLTEAQSADQIIVIGEGQVIDQGTHQELLTRCDLYQRLWRDYTAEEDPDFGQSKPDASLSIARALSASMLSALNGPRRMVDAEAGNVVSNPNFSSYTDDDVQESLQLI